VTCQFVECLAKIPRKDILCHTMICEKGPRSDDGTAVVGVKFQPHLFWDERNALNKKYAESWRDFEIVWNLGDVFCICFSCCMGLKDKCHCFLPYENVNWDEDATGTRLLSHCMHRKYCLGGSASANRKKITLRMQILWDDRRRVVPQVRVTLGYNKL